MFEFILVFCIFLFGILGGYYFDKGKKPLAYTFWAIDGVLILVILLALRDELNKNN